MERSSGSTKFDGTSETMKEGLKESAVKLHLSKIMKRKEGGGEVGKVEKKGRMVKSNDRMLNPEPQPTPLRCRG